MYKCRDTKRENNKKNILIIGNSHAEDALEILSKTNFKNKIYFIHFNHTNISLETNNSVIDSIADLGYNFSHFGDQLPL